MGAIVGIIANQGDPSLLVGLSVGAWMIYLLLGCPYLLTHMCYYIVAYYLKVLSVHVSNCVKLQHSRTKFRICTNR